jgi:hypothetical protein
MSLAVATHLCACDEKTTLGSPSDSSTLALRLRFRVWGLGFDERDDVSAGEQGWVSCDYESEQKGWVEGERSGERGRDKEMGKKGEKGKGRNREVGRKERDRKREMGRDTI